MAADRKFDIVEDFSLGSLEDGSGTSFLGAENPTIIGSEDLYKYMTGDNTPTETIETNNNKVEDNITTQNSESKKADEQVKALQLDKEDAVSKFNDFLRGKEEDVKENSEEKKEENSTIISKEKEDDSKDKTDDSYFQALSKDLFNIGVFTTDEDEELPEVNSPEEFVSLFNEQKKKGAYEIIENFLSRFGDEYKNMFDAVFANGVNPFDYIKGQKEISDVRNLDPANPEHAKQIFTSYFRAHGMSDDKIEDQLKKAIDFEYLESSAKGFQEDLIKITEKKEAEKIETKRQELIKNQTIEQEYQQSISKILTEKMKTKDIDGIPLNEKDAKEVYTYLVKKPYKLKDGQLLSEFDKDILELNNPQNHLSKIKLALLLKNKLDLSKVKKAAVSTKNEQLFTNLTGKEKQVKREESNKPKSIFE